MSERKGLTGKMFVVSGGTKGMGRQIMIEAVDGVVCNVADMALIRVDGPISEIELGDWTTIITANLTSTFLTTKYGIRAMLDSEAAGSVVPVSSMAAVRGMNGLDACTASKGAMESLARSFDHELLRALCDPLQLPRHRLHRQWKLGDRGVEWCARNRRTAVEPPSRRSWNAVGRRRLDRIPAIGCLATHRRGSDPRGRRRHRGLALPAPCSSGSSALAEASPERPPILITGGAVPPRPQRLGAFAAGASSAGVT